MMKQTASLLLSILLILNQSAYAKMPKSELFPSFSEKDESTILKTLAK